MANHTQLNTQLIEEFGNLERLCNQIYDDKHGVTNYINDMERLSSVATYRISDWNYDLKTLKNIRHKRNQLSHGEVSFNELWADSNDIKYAIRFRKRMLSQKDPLALYRQNIRQPKCSDNLQNSRMNQTNPIARQKSGCLSLFSIPIVIAFIVCFLFMIK